MTASHIRCLLAVLALSDEFERVASKDVARLLGVRKPTVHNTLAALKARGLIDKERYGDARLTEAGLTLARRLERMRDELTLLAGALGLEPAEGAQFAALLLAGLSPASVERLCAARCRALPASEAI